MQSVKSFLEMGRICPVCSNKLTLGVQGIGHPVFLESKRKYSNDYYTYSGMSGHKFQFLPTENQKIILEPPFIHEASSYYKEYKGSNSDGSPIYENSSYSLMNIEIILDNNNIKFNGGMHYKFNNYYWFYLCNPDALNRNAYNENYIIDGTSVCYYRSSETMNASQNYRFSNVPLAVPSVAMESFTINYNNKTYYLQLDHCLQSMDLFYKINNSKDLKHIKLPLRSNFDFNDKNKLINKFDNWIIMS